MAYQAPYIDATGAHIPSYGDILDYLIEKFRAIYGNDIYLDEDSQDYQFLSSLALLYYDCCQTFLLAYNNQSPTTAVGASLDRLCAINGIVRKPNSYSSCAVKLTGKPNASLAYGQVRDINGNLWQLDEEIVFDAQGEAESLAACTVPGPIQAAAHTVNEIATPTQNWYSVDNEIAAYPGETVETDSRLRERRFNSVSIVSVSPLDAITANIASLTDEDDVSIVKRVRVYENDTSVPFEGLPSHSIAVTVECDKNDQEVLNTIGEAIYLRKSPGVQTYKDPTTGVSVEVMSRSGLSNTINFNVPTEKKPKVIITINKRQSYAESTTNDIKQSVFNYLNELGIGEPIYITNLYLPILQSNLDSSNPSFYITSVVVEDEDGRQYEDVYEIGKFEAIVGELENIIIEL